MTTSPFGKPATPSGIAWDDLNGSLLMIDVKAHETGINTSYGESDAIRADVHVLDGDQVNNTYMDTLIFPKVLIRQLRGSIGQKVLGRLGQGEKKPGQDPPWILADATVDDTELGVAYLNRSTFAAPQVQAAADDRPPY